MRQIITKDLASIYTDVPTLRPGTIEAYALAFVSAEVATVVRLAIDPYVMGAECLTFFPAVMITTLIGGLAAGLFCLMLSAAAAAFLLMPPLTPICRWRASPGNDRSWPILGRSHQAATADIRAKLPPIAFGGSEIRSAASYWRPVQRGGLR